MLKITGCILIVAVGTAVGFLKARSLYRRRDFLKSFIVFLNSLSTYIRYDSSDIFTLISRSAESARLTFKSGDYNSYKEPNTPFSERWKSMTAELPKAYSLNESDRQMLSDFGEKLGATDAFGQLKHIELYTAISEKQLASAEEDISKKSKLYKAAGFFTGAAAALMFI